MARYTYEGPVNGRLRAPMAANLNTETSRGLVLTIDSDGNHGLTTDNTEPLSGVIIQPADQASAGSVGTLLVQGYCTVVTANATAIAVGDSLEGAAGGKVVKEGTTSSNSRLMALEASTAADTRIQAYLI